MQRDINVNPNENNIVQKRGFIAGMFDVIHPGYVDMFELASSNCEYLVVGLHENPKIERDSKLEPVLSVLDREKILRALKYVDDVVVYKTENDLFKILENGNFNVRFLGDDYKNKKFTGYELEIPVIYIDRSHGWSSTKFKEIIRNKNG
jgi:glycerol-3-phosphate cytidylyltransferase